MILDTLKRVKLTEADDSLTYPIAHVVVEVDAYLE